MSNETIGVLQVLLASVFYGFMPALTQLAFAAGSTVESVLAGKYLIGMILLWAYILIKRKNVNIGRSNMIFIGAVGIAIAVCVYCMASSYKYLPGAVASLIVFSYIIIVNIIELITGNERPNTVRLICLALATGGLIAVIYQPSDGNGLSSKGILFALITGILYSVWIMAMGAKRLRPFSPELVSGSMLIMPALINIANCIIAGHPVLPQNPWQWLYVSLLAIFPNFISPVIICAAVKRIGASTVSIINTSEPLVAYFAGMFLMGDRLSLNATLGGCAIILGILILNINLNRRLSPPIL